MKNAWHATIQGKDVYLLMRQGDRGLVQIDGIEYDIDLSDPRAFAAEDAQAAGFTGAIASLMPGMVLDVAVSVGDVVEKGDTLLVLEAMKMENPVQAPHGGKVSNVHVKKGQAVENRQTLITLDVDDAG